MIPLVVATASAQNWLQAPLPTAPSPRNSSAAAFDVYRGTTTLFGGYQGTSTPLGDTWEHNGTAWVPRVTLVHPAPRWGHCMAFDSKRGVVVLFGGFDGSGMRNDTWEWNGLGWSQRVFASAPPSRGYASMVFDSVRGVVVLIGGLASGAIANGLMQGDTWEYDGGAWQLRGYFAYPTGGRCAMASVFDEVRRETVMFGGNDGTQVLSDLWVWNGTSWSQRAATGPVARQAAVLAFDANCGRAVLHGGADATFATNYGDSWAWDGLQWTPIAGAQPPARHGAAMVHDAQRGQFVLSGGRGNAAFLADTWQLGAPCARTMTNLASPVLGQSARFAFDYPASAAASHFAWTVFTPRMPAALPLTILGLPSVGLCRVDLANQLQAPGAFLDASGRLTTSAAIPNHPAFTGIQFDVQSVDLDLATLTLRWAANDEEVTVLATGAGLPVAAFSATPTSGAAPLTVSFTNTSTGATSHAWDFGDGTFGTQANPAAKTYAGGTYTVWLSAIGANGASSTSQTLVVAGANAAPVASFTATPLTGSAPLTVQFTDTSTNLPSSWQWDFDDDGLVDSTQQHPVFTYGVDGYYTVRLQAANFLGTGVVSRTNLIRVGPVTPSPALNMVAIAPGTFTMGSTNGSVLEQPVHSVASTMPFWIGKYEVTQGQYQALTGTNPSIFGTAPNAAQRPVETVSWIAAMAYCAALTSAEQALGRVPVGYQYRLPTEAEWEYCCRAGTTTEWSTGNTLSTNQANFQRAITSGQYPNGMTAVVGSYSANAFGLHDMHGNVSEWCLDSLALYASGPVSDPFTTGGANRVIRGGDWSSPFDVSCRSAARASNTPYYVGPGFRVVLGPVLVP